MYTVPAAVNCNFKLELITLCELGFTKDVLWPTLNRENQRLCWSHRGMMSADKSNSRCFYILNELQKPTGDRK